MAKALGLIGNFKGKLGNTVGYSLKDSNNKQTQGVRVYQPVVRNPKTAAQAEQRAKLAPINATYRALKMVIDRGQEGKAYGNKSRLAWLSAAMKAFNGGWFEKGAAIDMPAIVPLTKGSLGAFNTIDDNTAIPTLNVRGMVGETTTTLGALSSALIAAFPFLENGDQVTFVAIEKVGVGIVAHVDSVIIDSTSTAAIPSFLSANDDYVEFFGNGNNAVACAVIGSREGDNGAHLRTSSSIVTTTNYDSASLADAAKEAAIESYMSQGANTDWAEESLM